MKKTITILIMAVALCSQAFAHTKLESSSPENGSILDKSPSEIMLSFNNKIRLTKVVLNKEGGKPVKLKLDKNKKFQTNFLLMLQLADITDESSIYSIEWRGIGQDGHVMKGNFTYTVK